MAEILPGSSDQLHHLPQSRTRSQCNQQSMLLAGTNRKHATACWLRHWLLPSTQSLSHSLQLELSTERRRGNLLSSRKWDHMAQRTDVNRYSYAHQLIQYSAIMPGWSRISAVFELPQPYCQPYFLTGFYGPTSKETQGSYRHSNAFFQEFSGNVPFKTLVARGQKVHIQNRLSVYLH